MLDGVSLQIGRSDSNGWHVNVTAGGRFGLIKCVQIAYQLQGCCMYAKPENVLQQTWHGKDWLAKTSFVIYQLSSFVRKSIHQSNSLIRQRLVPGLKKS